MGAWGLDSHTLYGASLLPPGPAGPRAVGGLPPLPSRRPGAAFRLRAEAAAMRGVGDGTFSFSRAGLFPRQRPAACPRLPWVVRC